MKYIDEIEKDFQKWMKKVKAEQEHYPALKGKSLSEATLRVFFERGKSPIDTLNTLNDLLTIC